MTLARPETPAPTTTELTSPPYALMWAMVICALAALTLAHPALAGGFLVNPRSDQFIAGYAFREYAADMLRTTGSFPLWNPYLFAGMPYVDAMHGDIFYPTFLLRLILPTDAAMTWGMIIHLWLAGIGAYTLFRAHRLPFHAALIGGLAYMLSGMVAGLVSPGHDGKMFISALLPFTMLLLRLGVRDGRGWSFGVLALVVGLGVLSPHPQVLQYLLLASGAYTLWMVFGEKGDGAPVGRVLTTRLALAAVAVVIGFAIGAVQYAPVLNYVDWSPRAGGAGWEHAISYSMPPEEIVSTFLPEFSGILDAYWGRNGIHLHSEYLGIAVLLIAAAAYGAADTARRRATWFWTGLMVVSGIWALGGFTPFYHLVYAIVPGTKFFRAPSTMMYVTAFSVAALAALGAARIATGEVGRRYFIIAASVVGVAILAGLTGGWNAMFESVVLPDRLAAFQANKGDVAVGAIRMGVFAAAALAVMFLTARQRLTAPLGLSLLAGVVAADLWSVDRKYWQFSPRAEQLYAADPAITTIKGDSVPGRVIALQLTQGSRDPFFNGDALMSHRVRSVLGYHGNELGRYQQMYGKFEEYRGLVSPTFWENYNVRWIYTDAPDLPNVFPNFTRVLGPVRNAFGSTVFLFRTPGENPLAWVAPAIVKVGDDMARASIASPGFPLKSVALFGEDAPVAGEQLAAPPAPLAIRARVARYEPGAIDIELDTPAPAKSALLVSENFYPGWEATVDGAAVQASRANFTIIGVPLTAGARRIELRFTSPAFGTGARITLVALIGAVMLAAAGGFMERRIASA